MLHNFFNEYHAYAKQKIIFFWGMSHVIAYLRFGSDANFDENLCRSNILENTPCAQGTDVFAMKLRYSLGKLFYKFKNITILNRNNNEKRQIQIMKMM